MDEVEQILQLLDKCSMEQRLKIFTLLRQEFAIHPIEAELNTRAEIILEAISRSGELFHRGVRGVIAEAAFDTEVIQRLVGWTVLPCPADPPYDFIDSR